MSRLNKILISLGYAFVIGFLWFYFVRDVVLGSPNPVLAWILGFLVVALTIALVVTPIKEIWGKEEPSWKGFLSWLSETGYREFEGEVTRVVRTEKTFDLNHNEKGEKQVEAFLIEGTEYVFPNKWWLLKFGFKFRMINDAYILVVTDIGEYKMYKKEV